MDDTLNTLISVANHNFSDFVDGEDADEFCDVETWETLSRSFREVQSVLDRNRRLIQHVNDNHRSKMPHNLAKNVALICEINSNMTKVVALYSTLSANLSATVRQRLTAADAAVKEIES